MSDAESVEVLAMGVDVVRAVERVVSEPPQPIEGWPGGHNCCTRSFPYYPLIFPGPLLIFSRSEPL